MKLFKTLLVLTLALALLLTLAACDNGDDKVVYRYDRLEEDFGYSTAIDDNGHWKDIDASSLVTLCDYKGIVIPAEIHTVSDETLNANIHELLMGFAEKKTVKTGIIKNGDTINIDYVGSVDGVAFEGGNTHGRGTEVTIGVTSYIDDFLEQLIGHTPGETVRVEVTFPDNYNPSTLAGKDALFIVTINRIVEYILPELTDEFVAEKLSEKYKWSTVQQMREEIAEQLHTNSVNRYVCDYLVEHSTVASVPEVLYWYQVQSMLFFYQPYADSYGISLLSFVQNYVGFSSIKALEKYFEASNRDAANFHLLVQAIVEDSELSVTGDDIKAYFLKTKGSEDYSKDQELYGLPYIKMMVLYRSVVDLMVENAVLE